MGKRGKFETWHSKCGRYERMYFPDRSIRGRKWIDRLKNNKIANIMHSFRRKMILVNLHVKLNKNYRKWELNQATNAPYYLLNRKQGYGANNKGNTRIFTNINGAFSLTIYENTNELWGNISKK